MNKVEENDDKKNVTPLASLNLIQYKHYENCQKGKLLVLGLDRTLCDFGQDLKVLLNDKIIIDPVILRPNLHWFLKTVNEYYDIALWSATKLEVIKLKMDAFNLRQNENFKIDFVLDKTNMVPIRSQCLCTCCASKALSVIWEKYPKYDKTNTIIVDDNVDNFHFNPNNGLLMKRYKQSRRDVDNHLERLAAYLIELAKNSYDFTVVDHATYRDYS